MRIFNINIKNYKNKIKTYIIANISYIIAPLLLILWFFLLYYSFITLARLFTFFIIMLFIVLYKKLLLYIKSSSPIKNIYILIILIYIDKLKLILINIIEYIYIFIFDCWDIVYILNFSPVYIKIVTVIEWLIKLILINPILLVLHKFYYVLYLWHDLPLKTLFISRFFGIIVSVLVFTPIINYILFNYNWLYIYLIILIISVLDDAFNYFNLSRNKYFKYIGVFLYFLKIRKDIIFAVKYRSNISIFAILIRKGVNEVEGLHSLLNSFSYLINYTYSITLIKPIGDLYKKDCKENRRVIDYDSMLVYSKIIGMKESIVKTYNTLFRVYSLGILSNLDSYLMFIGVFNAYKLQKYYELDTEKLDVINHLEGFVYRLCKVILFYFFSISKILGMDNVNIYKSLKIGQVGLVIDLKYDFWDSFYESLIKDKKDYNNWEILKKIDEKVVYNSHFYIYSLYYEQVYLYSCLYDFNNFKIDLNKSHIGVNIKIEYKYISDYIIMLNECSKFLLLDDHMPFEFVYEDLLNSLQNYPSSNNYNLIYNNQLEFKSKIIAEWEVFSQGLSKENFYDKNYACLAELNLYIKMEVSRLMISEKKNNVKN